MLALPVWLLYVCRGRDGGGEGERRGGAGIPVPVLVPVRERAGLRVIIGCCLMSCAFRSGRNRIRCYRNRIRCQEEEEPESKSGHRLGYRGADTCVGACGKQQHGHSLEMLPSTLNPQS